MNLTYAVPAAIALAAHALIFLGSGGPPKLSMIVVPPATPPGKDPWEVLLKPEPLPPAPDDDSSAGDKPDVIAPPRIIEPPPISKPAETGITQKYVCVESGTATKLTALNVGMTGGSETSRKQLTIDNLDEKPRTRFQKAPTYPLALKNTGTTGTVWVEFLVDEKGWVHDVRVVKSTNPGFDDATVTALSQWRFESGKRKGIPVSFRMSIPIVFNLND